MLTNKGLEEVSAHRYGPEEVSAHRHGVGGGKCSLI